MLEVENLQVRYGDQVALNIRDKIHIEAGERIGLIGGNGAGKSTFINAVLRLVPYTGKVDMSFTKDRIGVHLQSNEYTDTMSCLSLMKAVTGTSPAKNERLKELVEFFHFEDSLKKKYKNLSGGQKQRFTLILVLFQDKDLVFFDEVTSGLDFETRQNLVNLLKKWYSSQNVTLFYVSHYYEELENLVDKVLLLEKGEVVCFGAIEELFRTYCGRAIYVLPRTQENEQLTAEFDQLAAPAHMIALRADTEAADLEISRKLITHNCIFKRSNQDIEIMTYNAREQYLLRKGEK